MGLFDFLKFRSPAQVVPTAPASPHELLMHEVEAALGETRGVTRAQRLPADFALRVEHQGVELVLYLSGLLADVQDASPEERRDRIAHFVGTLLQNALPHERSLEAVRDRLALSVRPAMYADASDGNDIQLPSASRPFLPFLSAQLVVDEPGSIAYLHRPQLENWGVPEADLFDLALQNLGRLVPGDLEPYPHPAGPAWQAPGENPYAASLLLRPGWLAAMRGRVEGRPLAIIPERSTLLVAGDARPDLVHWLADKAQREYQASYRNVSPAVYTVDDSGTVVPYRPTRGTDAGNLVHRGHAMLLAQSYAEQQVALERHYARMGIDVYVAQVGVSRRSDGSPCTWCTWADGVACLLPRTDVVIVGGGEAADGTAWHAAVSFDTARSLGGPMWQPGEALSGPERHHATGRVSSGLKTALLLAHRSLDELG